MSKKRFRLFADAKLQTSLCVRVIGYWLVCQATFSVTVLALTAFETSAATGGTGSPWRLIVPALITSSIVLPIVLLDLLLVSNRFAGPMVRFRRHLHELNLSDNNVVKPIQFRKGDYYQDLCQEFNRFRENNASQTPTPDTSHHEQVSEMAHSAH